MRITKDKINGIRYSLGTIYKYIYIFNQELPGYHTAVGDTIACAKIYFKIKYNLDTIDDNRQYEHPIIKSVTYTDTDNDDGFF